MQLTIAHPAESAPDFKDFDSIVKIEKASYRPEGFEYVEIVMEQVTGFATEEDLSRVDFSNGDTPLRVDSDRAWVVSAEDGTKCRQNPSESE